MIGNYLNISTFKQIILELNKYLEKKYDSLIPYDKYKKIVGDTMIDYFNINKYKVDKETAIKKTINILKKIIDNDMNKNFFKIEKNTFNDLKKFEEKNVKELLPLPPPKLKKTFIEQTKHLPVEEKIIETKKDKNMLIQPISYQEFVIDSRDRNWDVNPNPNQYEIQLTRGLHNIISIELLSAEIPKTDYIINQYNNKLYFEETNGTELTATITIGDYTIAQLLVELKTQLEAIGGSTYTVVESGRLITITSDLSGGGGVFHLNFNNTTNSIARKIGFEEQQFTGSSNYTSSMDVIMDEPEQVYLEIFNLNNIHTLSDWKDKFILLSLNCPRGEYEYIKNYVNNDGDIIDNEYRYDTQTPTDLRKLNIVFRNKQTKQLYDFNGRDHNLHFRVKYFNFRNQVNN
jgi:hypothetical protein